MRMRYKILIAILISLLLFYLLVLYVNRTFIPVKLKALLVKKITEQSGREVDIEQLKFSMAKGFVLNGVKIYEGPKENNQLLFKAERISFGIIFIPSLKKYSLIIPRLWLDEPHLNLKRLPDGSLHICSLLKKEDKKKKPSPYRLIVKSLTFDKGELSFTDYYGEKTFQKTLTALKGGMGFSLPNSVTLSCTGQVDDSPIRITARYGFLKKELFLELETKNLMLADYCQAYLPELISEGQINRLTIASGLGDIFLKINMSDFEAVRAGVNLSIQNLQADFDGVKARGNYRLTGTAGFNIKALLGTLGYNLKLELEKARLSTPLKSLKNIDQIDGAFSLSEKRWATKELSCLLYGSPTLITGTINSPHRDFVVDALLSSTLALKNIADIVGIDIESGQAAVQTKVAYNKKDASYHIVGKTEIENLKMYQKEILISGDFSISGESWGIAGDIESLAYQGNIDFAQAKIEGVGMFPFISDASGNAAFSTKHITIKRLDGVCADTKIALSGSVDYARPEPAVAFKLKADNLSLSKFLSTLPEQVRTKLKDIEVSGRCALNLNFNGTPGQPETFSYEGGLLLKKASLTIPYWPNHLTDIDCELSFNRQEIIWKDLDFNINAIRYHCYGRFTDFNRPKISLSFSSKDMELIGDIKIEGKIIDILQCKGKFLGSSFSITGKVSDIKNPYAVLSGNVNFDLGDTVSIFKDRRDLLNKLKPKGIIPLTFNIQGPLKEAAEWALYVEGGADNIYIWGLRLDDFYIDYRMKDRFIDIPVIAAHPYGGIINISSRINLKTEDRPYIINIDIKDLDLHQLVEDTEFKNKKIRGSFAAKSILNGYLDKKDSLKGSGWLQVSDGYLWEFPVMRGILEVIFMLPPDYVTLTDAFGNFSVYNNRIRTEDFKMLSKTASLLWVGWLGFDGTLDFNITGRFAEDIVKKTTEPGKIASAILREAGSLIMEIKLGGTLAQPKYQIVPFPVQRIFKEKVVDKFKDIFGDIFE